MNAVEIEQAISELAELPFEAAEFSYAFLTAFGNKATTIKRLRAGTSNKALYENDGGEGWLKTRKWKLSVAM